MGFRIASLGVLFLFGWIAPGQAQVTRVVDDDGQGSVASCQDGSPAFTTIAAAIAAAANGDTVLVCPGTYVGNLDYGGKSIAVQSVNGPSVTTIDGNAAGTVVTFTSGEGPSSVLEGFTLRNGRSGTGPPGFGDGGGIRMENASPTIRGNVIVDNRGCSGIGISVRFGSPSIEANTIADNVQSGCSGGNGGGGISIVGPSTAHVVANRIARNILPSSNGGGGISLNGAGSPTIERNVIEDNVVTGVVPCSHGGGILMINESNAIIVGNLIVRNSAGCGGGIYWAIPPSSPRLVNNTLADNDSPEGSGIFAAGFNTGAVVVNNIVVAAAGQTAIICGNGFDVNPPTLLSNDIYSPSGDAYGGVCADQTGVNGNMSVDPLFADAPAHDYHLRSTSATIDAGENTESMSLTSDLDGDARRLDSDGDGVAVVDLGADESPTVAGPRGTITGLVTNAGTGAGLPAMTVQVYAATGALVKSASTAGGGTFGITGLATGTYYARTFSSAEQNYVDKLYNDLTCLNCTVTTGSPITVTAGTTSTGINFALATGGGISGTVTGASPGSLLSAVTVEVRAGSGTLVKKVTTINGHYSVVGLSAGTYYVRVVVRHVEGIFPDLQNYVGEVFDNIPCLNCPATAGTPITVTQGTTRAGVDFALSQGGVVTGMVTDATTGSGLAGVTVQVYTSSGNLAKTVVTPGGGFYTVDGLASGTYYARTAVPASLRYADQLYDNMPCLNCAATTGTPIVVTAGAQKGGINFVLFPVAPSIVSAGPPATFMLTNAADVRWAAAEVVAGRSYCAQLAPGPTAVDRATPTLSAAVYQPFVTTFLGSSTTRVCFVAPNTGTVLFKITQADSSSRPYRLSLVETTMWANWFFIGADYSSFSLLRNTTGATVTATLTWRNQSGAAVFTGTVAVPAHALVIVNARSVVSGATTGSIEIGHDGEPQAIVGSQTTLSGTTGVSFDTILMQRRPW